ncbi:ABC transporter permease [Kitasatospora sp. NBC_01250]|uniref:ABC transporter permease n=1 Tax=unclassified Kitasatospora TaxID=2633591 RepID=UPI002E12248D|nr:MULTISPECIES: ABC transporter permease [unclassified Kitasatospora]WSJ65970.1 ABC transporter permease [Kitasatospora sp. NBC_01302]
MSTSTPLMPLPHAGTDPVRARRGRSAAWAFCYILWRDIFVTGRELVPFLAQVVVEPFFILFVFGKVLTGIGYTGEGFQEVLLPGVVALSSFLVALQNTAFPLIVDFSFTKEIEDRLLSPIPLGLVAVEKLLFGAIRGLIGAGVMIPLGFLLLDHVHWPLSSVLPVAGILVLGSLAGATVGMTIGTAVDSRHISIIIAVVLTPLMFTGATQFPWFGLSVVRPFQVVCALNPLTYVSEGLRSVLIPHSALHSIPLGIDLAALVAACLLYGLIGIRGFRKRALD